MRVHWALAFTLEWVHWALTQGVWVGGHRGTSSSIEAIGGHCGCRLASGAIAAIALGDLILTLSVLLDNSVLGVSVSVLFEGFVSLMFVGVLTASELEISKIRRYYRIMPLGIAFDGLDVDSDVAPT